jgi:hypothetical protein
LLEAPNRLTAKPPASGHRFEPAPYRRKLHSTRREKRETPQTCCEVAP